jgi:integrase
MAVEHDRFTGMGIDRRDQHRSLRPALTGQPRGDGRAPPRLPGTVRRRIHVECRHGRTKEPNPLPLGQVEALARALPAPLDLLIRFAAWSGLRAAEVVGLQVRDLPVLQAEVHVVRTARRRGNTVQVGTPKSKKSTGRYVPVQPVLVRLLQAHIAAHSLGPEDYLFGEPDGGPLRYGAFYKGPFKRACRAVGLPTLRFHDLRHTFVVLKLGQGYGIHELKEWMGHSTVNVTIDLYGKWVRGDEEARRAKDDAAFLAVRPAAPVTALPAR